jgi:hypothetical protein
MLRSAVASPSSGPACSSTPRYGRPPRNATREAPVYSDGAENVLHAFASPD